MDREIFNGSNSRSKTKDHKSNFDFSFSGILVRNNLTGIELVTFSGESVLGEFKFGKFRHDHHSNKIEEERESAILEFDMKEKHLKDCDRKYF